MAVGLVGYPTRGLLMRTLRMCIWQYTLHR
jgi:hypothetical protein